MHARTLRDYLFAGIDVLARFEAELKRIGMAGDFALAKLLYLIITSRLLRTSVSAVVKGPSASGKSFRIQTVLRFFPDDAFRRITTVSKQSLAYMEDMHHQTLFIDEEDGIDDPTVRVKLRALLSEGTLIHQTVEGGQAKKMVVSGPMNLITTSTKPMLHHETETRVLSLHVDDSPEQIKAIMLGRASAERGKTLAIDPAWHELQESLAARKLEVVVPYERTLVHLMPAGPSRMTRDFGRLTSLIAAHALLHLKRRKKTKSGKVIASIADYKSVRALILPHFEEAIEASVPHRIREVVEAVRELRKQRATVSFVQIAQHLGTHRSTVSRRAQDALAAGYLRNAETNPAKPAALTIGQPLPQEVRALPLTIKLEKKFAQQSRSD